MAQGRYLSRSVEEHTASMAAVGEESAAGEISTVSIKPYVLTLTEIFCSYPHSSDLLISLVNIWHRAMPSIIPSTINDLRIPSLLSNRPPTPITEPLPNSYLSEF